MTLSNKGSYAGRAPAANWFSAAGSFTLNGTTAVADTAFNLPQHCIAGMILCKVTSGSGVGVVTYTLFNSDFFSTLANNVGGHLISQAMPAIASGLSGGLAYVGENSGHGISIMPSGLYTVSAVCSAAETGTFSWQFHGQVG